MYETDLAHANLALVNRQLRTLPPLSSLALSRLRRRRRH